MAWEYEDIKHDLKIIIVKMNRFKEAANSEREKAEK